MMMMMVMRKQGVVINKHHPGQKKILLPLFINLQNLSQKLKIFSKIIKIFTPTPSYFLKSRKIKFIPAIFAALCFTILPNSSSQPTASLGLFCCCCYGLFTMNSFPLRVTEWNLFII
jgi:hypothetical protein